MMLLLLMMLLHAVVDDVIVSSAVAVAAAALCPSLVLLSAVYHLSLQLVSVTLQQSHSNRIYTLRYTR